MSHRALIAPILLLAACGPTNQSRTRPTTHAEPLTPPTEVAAFPEAVADEQFTTNVARVSFAEEGDDFDPCISRDGAQLVFASTQHRTTSDIYIKRLDSRTVTQLTSDPADDSMPALSPDGTRIAFASNRSGNWDIYTMPAAGGKAVQVTSELTDEIHPSWSADGARLVFNRHGESSDRWEMWVADAANPVVANFIGYGLFPRWSPVAERIVYQLPRERGRRSFSLWTLDLTDGVASNPTQLADSTTNALINPAWSPDGNWIAFAEVPADAGETHPSNAALWMMSVATDERVRLTTGPGVSLSPAWATNNRLFFVSNRSGTDNVWSMDLSSAIASSKSIAPTAATTQPPTTLPADNSHIADVPEHDGTHPH